MTGAASDSRLPALDGIRGIAILLILFHHFTDASGLQPTTALDRAYFRLAAASWFGVDLFFVLSGFLITGILLRTKRHERYLWNFYARRILRIFPLYYATLALVFWVLPRIMPSPALDATLKHQVWYWLYLPNVLIAKEGWPLYSGVGHLWSLGVEEQFYLGWPLIVLVSRRRTLLQICLLAMLVSLLIRWDLVQRGYFEAAYVLMPARVDALMAGAVLAVLRTQPSYLKQVGRLAPALAGLAILGIGIGALEQRGLSTGVPAVITLGLSSFTVLFAALLARVLLAPPGSPLHRLLTGKTLRFFGHYSYGLYVMHWLLIHRLLDLGVSAAVVKPWHGSVLPGVLALSLLGTGLTVLLAMVSWHFLEQPFLNLKRHFDAGT